jgi:histidine ammonia-lyase
VILLARHDQLDLASYVRIAFERERIELAAEVIAEVDRRRAMMLAHLDDGRPAYGVNTGLGYLASRPVAADDQAAFQRTILVARAGAVAPPLSEPVVRGTMLLRLSGFLSGHAGVSGGLCAFIADRLNDGWLPVVPAAVSGAPGETVPLAHLFQTFLGEGDVLVDGKTVPAATALRSRGIEPCELGPKEGVALINGAPVAPALAILLALRAQALIEHATLAGTLAVAVIGASARPYSVRVGELKGDPGQLRVHDRMSELLAGGGRWDSAAQAPVSLRVIPQVHGAALELLGRLQEQLGRELRAVTDSPVFLAAPEGRRERQGEGERAGERQEEGQGAGERQEEGQGAGERQGADERQEQDEREGEGEGEGARHPEGLYPTGNFHAQALTTLLDAVAIAVAQVLNLVEKRMHRLLDSRFSGLPEQLSWDPGRHSGLVILHKQVIGLAAEAASLAVPGSIRATDASTGQEDFQAHTILAARQLEQILCDLELALAYELVALRQAHDLAGRPLSPSLQRALAAVADVVPEIREDRSLAADVARVRALIAGGTLAPEAPRWSPLLEHDRCRMSQ